MGEWIDYFAPIDGATYCEMLQSYQDHKWSADGKTWKIPVYYGDGQQPQYIGQQPQYGDQRPQCGDQQLQYENTGGQYQNNDGGQNQDYSGDGNNGDDHQNNGGQNQNNGGQNQNNAGYENDGYDQCGDQQYGGQQPPLHGGQQPQYGGQQQPHNGYVDYYFYDGDIANDLGGSAKWYPADNGTEGDVRMYLSRWGSDDGSFEGGCCSNSSSDAFSGFEKAGFGKAFAMYYGPLPPTDTTTTITNTTTTTTSMTTTTSTDTTTTSTTTKMTTAAAAATSPTVDGSIGINSDTSASPNAGLIAGILLGLVACGIGAAMLIRRKKKPSAEDAAAVAELQEEEARRNTTIMEVNPHLAALKAKKAASLSASLPSSTLIKSTSTVHNPAFVGIKLAEGGSSGNPAIEVHHNPANEPVGSDECIDVADDNTGVDPDQINPPWFVRGMDKGECKARVAAAKKQGSFLVRVSRKTAGAYVFCINLGDGQVQEDIAKPGRGGQLALYFNKKRATPPQPDLVSLVEYCQTHSLTPSVGITLKLGAAAPAVLAEYAPRAATASDAVYATLYGQVDSGLLQFYNRVAVENHEKDEPRPDNDPLAALASTPTVSLEKAIKAAEIDCGAGSLAEFLREARAFRANNAAGLSRFQMPDEAIETFYMYTVESPLYKKMNAALGNYTLDDDEDDPRSKLKHYLPFVKLLAAAIDLLPSVRQIVYRGANQPYEVLLNGKGVGEIITWWGFTSTSEKTRALQTPAFLNAVVTTTPDGAVIGVNNLEVYANLGPPPKKTIFQIHTISGVNIKCFSAADEDEIILRAGTRFLITSIKLWKHGITEVRMAEVDSVSNAADEPVAYNEIDHYMALDPEVEVIYAVAAETVGAAQDSSA